MDGKIGLIHQLDKFLGLTENVTSLCREHSAFYLNALSNRSTWALKMWDAAAKIQAGLLTGNIHSLGNFDECMEVSGIQNDNETFQGQYCLATVKLNVTSVGALDHTVDMVLEEEEINYGMGKLLSQGIRWGFCIPSSCDFEDLKNGLQHYLGSNASVDVNVGDCSNRSIGWIGYHMFIFIFVLGMVGIVFLKSLHNLPCNRRHFNYPDLSPNPLFNTEEDTLKYGKYHPFHFQRANWYMPTLDGLKTFSLIWALLGQSFLLAESLPAMNYLDIIKYMRELPMMFLLNAGLAADTFLVCSGALTAYHFFRDMRKRELITEDGIGKGAPPSFIMWYLPKYYAHRCVRLTPAFATVMAAYILYLAINISGPLGEPMDYSQFNVCNHTAFKSLFYVQNFMYGTQACLQNSWYTMVDMQLYILSPIVLFLFLKKYKIVTTLSVGFTGFAVGCICWFYMKYDIPASFLTPNEDKWLTKVFYEMNIITKLPSWFIGVKTGHLLYLYRNKGIDMKQRYNIILWSVMPVLMIAAVYGLYPFQQPDNAISNIWHTLYYCTSHIGWAIGIAWIIIICELTNYGGMLKQALTIKLFQPISRMSFCMYLVHAPVVSYRVLTTRTPVYVGRLTGVSNFFGDVFTSFLWALPLCLLVEMSAIREYEALAKPLGCSARFTQELENQELPTGGEQRGQEGRKDSPPKGEKQGQTKGGPSKGKGKGKSSKGKQRGQEGPSESKQQSSDKPTTSKDITEKTRQVSDPETEEEILPYESSNL